MRAYGRYCAFSYSGCRAEQPCDALDLCCQIHDWCVGVESYTSCECGHMLHECISSLTETDYEQSGCPYMRDTAKLIKQETGAQLLTECFNHDYAPKCGPDVNCNGIGSCRFDGGCDCPNDGTQHYAYDAFGRTGCECTQDYYPSCGANGVAPCKTYCNVAQTCNGQGLCGSDGSCKCYAQYAGATCNSVAPGYSMLYYYVRPHTVHAWLSVVLVVGVACGAVAAAALTVGTAMWWRHRRAETSPLLVGVH
eukprot:TRINITY_DN1849_c0_g1_i1.p1 TRINITY_DN1849_c0_g1~~TRINITY_DN1849_c0_g1_i1.p1  ORF type:complete len:251 (+),score=49.99 TRINITY_DN1849_c0_g1_i1:586-1338(+)